MMKIWSMKKKQQEEEAAAAATSNKKKVEAYELRAQKDVQELSLPSTMEVKLPKGPNVFTKLQLSIDPDEGMYKGGHFEFDIECDRNYPYQPPKVQCVPKIYHPNIDLNGKVCLNILREDWKPVLNLNAVFIGLQFLFLEPNASDPLNKEAAEDLKQNREGFKRNVRAAMSGGEVKGVEYARVLK